MRPLTVFSIALGLCFVAGSAHAQRHRARTGGYKHVGHLQDHDDGQLSGSVFKRAGTARFGSRYALQHDYGKTYTRAYLERSRTGVDRGKSHNSDTSYVAAQAVLIPVASRDAKFSTVSGQNVQVGVKRVSIGGQSYLACTGRQVNQGQGHGIMQINVQGQGEYGVEDQLRAPRAGRQTA